jgi:glucosyl-dolichyl phosphate glucuronosyltransferase
MVELSVIVPTRNRAPLLRTMLSSLREQTFPRSRFEVIVVDNGSTDETANLVAEMGARYIREEEPGLHRGRHAGMRAAAADLLVFADDDVTALPSWLESVHEAFRSWNAVLVGGRNLPAWEGTPPPWLRTLWERDRRIGYLSVIDLGNEIKPVDPSLVWGCNYAILRSVLNETRGFHPDAMPEELLRFRGDGESYVSRFVAERGLRAVYHPGAAVMHAVPRERMTIDYFERRAFAQGVSDSFTALRSGKPPRPDSLIRRLRLLMPWRRFDARLHGAYRRGFAWHQDLYRTDDAVRAWVTRPDYLGD